MLVIVEPAELLRTARQRHGLTQAALAARAGTSQPVISAYEHGLRDPTTRTLRRLVSAAGDRLELHLASLPPDIPPPSRPEEHAGRLVDVLLLADAIGHGERAALAYPRIDSS
ncbi:MAG: helix-turn-helix transcriptional regulator [Acidimicrobiaceae bacterium]|nr:helix-turn-helix transcriptional regulator [Acidimicrobiaceae bacterium]MXW61122.1 helix-turn-helix transcriptional regulator [Acidimicrobiaceae bacterium]MXW75406.1 helix-turn-helix transcriptional regulator [Acidimicrobiaceae bacterium]MYA75850.1 helix-turn-helix transcriptional regulator [Acidimicrobiaceae bacterium]MYC41776.1 helix-turn-helix transcriptional regulator [Acidimicrobiaceae bacterium]